MKRSRSLVVSIGLSLLGVATAARADILAPTSYDEPNGFGQASGGSYNYWDVNYSGSGNTTQDGAPLSGGLGKLTDGVITDQNWFAVSNTAGTGPYVGWREIDPTITFHFAGVAAYSEVDIHVDNAQTGGVTAPGSVTISDGTHSMDFATPVPGATDPFWIMLDVSALGLSGDTVSVTLHRSDIWVFSDEIRFQGRAVPEPGTLGLMALGLSLAAAARRRRGS